MAKFRCDGTNDGIGRATRVARPGHTPPAISPDPVYGATGKVSAPRRSGGIGRRASLRGWCPTGRGGSSPPSDTCISYTRCRLDNEVVGARRVGDPQAEIGIDTGLHGPRALHALVVRRWISPALLQPTLLRSAHAGGGPHAYSCT